MNWGRYRCVPRKGNGKRQTGRLEIKGLVSMEKQPLRGSWRDSFSKKALPSRCLTVANWDKDCLIWFCFALVELKVFGNRVPNLNRYFLGSVANSHKMLYRSWVFGRMTQAGVSSCKEEWRETKAGLLQAVTTNQNCPRSCCSHRAV